MANMIDGVELLKKPRNVPMYIETRDGKITFEVAWAVTENEKWVEFLPTWGGRRTVRKTDDYNRTWRGWDALPAKKDIAAPWLVKEG